MVDKLNSKPDRKDIEVSKLDFDPENPRFPPEIASGPTNELLERFIRDERLLEIVTSIADQGYFEGEPLLVTPREDRYIVIEGNRRLAALKLLTGELKAPEGRISVDEASETATFKPSKVPCLIFEDPDQTLRYLGFRHITGIKAWGPLQKARYLKKLREKFFLNLDSKNQLTHLAREIGSRSDYIGQILASLNLYERAEQNNFYEIQGLNPDEIEFSVLSTALSYKSIANYIGLDGRQDIEGDNVIDESLKNILKWMFVARSDQKTILGDSRNLGKLAAIVESDKATLALIKDGNLDSAFQLSKGPAQAFSLALESILKKLQDSWSWLPQVDSPNPEDDERIEEIRKLASLLKDSLKSKRTID